MTVLHGLGNGKRACDGLAANRQKRLVECLANVVPRRGDGRFSAPGNRDGVRHSCGYARKANHIGAHVGIMCESSLRERRERRGRLRIHPAASGCGTIRLAIRDENDRGDGVRI